MLPRLVLGELSGKKARKIACGSAHAVAATSEGAVLTWGSNLHSELGYALTDAAHQEHPKVVQSLASHKVVAVAAAMHTIVCTDIGRVYAFGSNLSGQLGASTQADFGDCREAAGLVTGLEGQQVVHIAAGPWQTNVATSSRNSVYEFTSTPVSNSQTIDIECARAAKLIAQFELEKEFTAPEQADGWSLEKIREYFGVIVEAHTITNCAQSFGELAPQLLCTKPFIW